MDEIKKIIPILDDISVNNKTFEFIYPQNDILYTKNVSDLSVIKYIFVGDNPSTQEKDELKFFVGDSGQQLRLFCEKYLQISENDYMMINKSCYFSKATSELEEISSIQSFIDNQIDMANLIIKLLDKNKEIFVALLGVEYFELQIDSDKYCGLFADFYKTLFNSNYENRVGLYYHPSRRYPLTLNQQKQINEKGFNDLESKINIFKEYGIEELKNRMRKSQDTFSLVLEKYKL